MLSKRLPLPLLPPSSSSSTNRDKIVIGNPRWAWVVAVSCCWINMFIFGVFRSAGVLYRAFVETYGCTYGEASWPISLAGSVASITGLSAGFLTHYFEIRIIVFFGVLICSFSISICYFASNIIFIIISLGIIQGIGIGLVTNLLPAIISQYFTKQRAAACGLSYAGATTGAFIFPLFIEWQLNEFGLRGSLLLMGGITLHGLIGALLLRTPKSNNPRNNKIEENKMPLIKECNTKVYLSNNSLNLKSQRQRPKSIADFNVIVTMRDDRFERNKCQRMSLPLIDEKKMSYVNEIDNHTVNEKSDSTDRTLWENIKHHVKDDAKIFCNIHFHLISITYLVFIINFVSFLIILPDFAKDRGLSDHEGTLLLSLFAVTDLLGRLVPGWISYFGIIANNKIYAYSIALMGFSISLMPLANANFGIFAALTLSCGFFTGCQMVLPPVIISEYLGVDKTAIAFGLTNFICGVISMVFRPFMIGLKDNTGEYNVLFYCIGLMGIFSTILWMCEFFNVFRCKR